MDVSRFCLYTTPYQSLKNRSAHPIVKNTEFTTHDVSEEPTRELFRTRGKLIELRDCVTRGSFPKFVMS